MADNSHQKDSIVELQRLSDPSPSSQQVVQKKENKTGLPDKLKTGVENLSGYSMDDVQVHFNSNKPAPLQAHAFTQGTDIYLANGQEKHLPHEAWHVAQQKQGRVKPTLKLTDNININDDAGLEKEADVMGSKALQKHNTYSSSQLESSQTNSKGTLNTQSHSPFSSVIQGKFGFEIETKLILAAGAHNADPTDKTHFTKPDDYLTNFPKVATGNGFKVHLDHSGSFKSIVEGGPIAELVTDPPIDEATQSEEEAAGIAQNMADAATSMGTAPTVPSKLSSKSNINSVQATGSDIYVGFPGASNQNTYGYVQATFGVKLASVPKMLTHMATPEMAASPKARTIFRDSVTKAEAVRGRLRAQLLAAMGTDNFDLSDAWSIYHSKKHDRNYHYHQESGKSQWDRPSNADQVDADFKQLEGYLALVLQYLIAGQVYGRSDVPTNLLKNAIGQFFYKTKLSTLAKGMHGWARFMLQNPDWRAIVKYELLTECGRNPNEYMSQAMASRGIATIKVGDWLDNIFSGKDDNIFTDSINPWSDELIDEVGVTDHQAPSAVVENRRVNPLGGQKKYGPGVTPQEIKGWMKPEDWPNLARYYHKMLSALNAIDPETPPESQAL